MQDTALPAQFYFVNPKDGIEMVLVPGGWFWMGSGDEDGDAYDDEKPKHLHYVAPFYLALTCVTVAQFREFVKETGHTNKENWDKDPDDHPVRYVNWHDAKAYCDWAGLRLPTEAEWELTARGYGALKYPWGNDWENGQRVCWDKQKGPQGNTAPIWDHSDGSGCFGIFQQSGNLLEWCEDWYDKKAYKRYAEGDRSLPNKGSFRVLRGGSWFSYDTKYLRGAARLSYPPDFRSYTYGFRCARTVTF